MIACIRRQRGALRIRPCAVAALAMIAASASAVSLPATAAASIGARNPVIKPLSDGSTRSQWAYPSSAAIARVSPSARARAVGRLRFLTGDGQAQLYMVLASAQLPSGQSWLEVELP